MLNFAPQFLMAFICLVPAGCRSSATLPQQIKTGAERMEEYLPFLKDKSIGIVANHTSVVGKIHLADTLVGLGIKVAKIFAPEHGFRGIAGAGDIIHDTIDGRTGIEIVSIYGSSVKPSPQDLEGIDLVIYDIQDVGVRFYTYISTLHYVMEACSENDIPLIVLDRPDPLGHYIDGPVLDTSYRSFVGMDPIPVVYGMTPGELAIMINSEGWLRNGIKCDLSVIQCSGYDHNTFYSLPINPSPNLNSMEAVYLYPSVCFFEGTIMSLGRGTEYPFRVIGHPGYPVKSFSFVPQQNRANTNPVLLNKECFGLDLRYLSIDTLRKIDHLNLEWLSEIYLRMGRRKDFFTDNFDRLAGTDRIRLGVLNGQNPSEIRSTWQNELEEFKLKRKKYLLYNDFE